MSCFTVFLEDAHAFGRIESDFRALIAEKVLHPRYELGEAVFLNKLSRFSSDSWAAILKGHGQHAR